MARVRIVGSEAALERFRRAYPDLGAALADLKEAPFPPTLEVFFASRGGAARRDRDRRDRRAAWQGVEAAESEEESDRSSATPSGSSGRRPLPRGRS